MKTGAERRDTKMDAGQFVEKAKKIIVDYVNNRLCRTPKIGTEDVFIV